MLDKFIFPFNFVGDSYSHKMKDKTKESLITASEIVVALLIVFITAFTVSAMYAGECMEVDLGKLDSSNIAYTVVGNSSSLEGLTIDLDGSVANICTVLNYQPDEFTLVFMDDSTQTIIKEVQVSGGSQTIYKDRNVTEFIEVDNYIDRIIDDTTIGIEETGEVEEPKKKVRFGLIIILFIVGAGIAYMVISFIRNKREEEEDE